MEGEGFLTESSFLLVIPIVSPLTEFHLIFCSLLSDYFQEYMDLVPSDIVCGLILLRRRQKVLEARHISRFLRESEGSSKVSSLSIFPVQYLDTHSVSFVDTVASRPGVYRGRGCEGCDTPAFAEAVGNSFACW